MPKSFKIITLIVYKWQFLQFHRTTFQNQKLFFKKVHGNSRRDRDMTLCCLVAWKWTGGLHIRAWSIKYPVPLKLVTWYSLCQHAYFSSWDIVLWWQQNKSHLWYLNFSRRWSCCSCCEEVRTWLYNILPPSSGRGMDPVCLSVTSVSTCQSALRYKPGEEQRRIACDLALRDV
jgi:hypothetical protein